MKGFFRRVLLASATLLFLTGCNRHADEQVQIAPGEASGESEDVGYLALDIVKIYDHQKPLEQSPWHADGGDWTFLDCRLKKDSSITVLIGGRIKNSENSGDGSPVPTSWGEARLSVSDAAAGARFVDAFAKAFHTQSPLIRSNNPTGLLSAQTAVLGTELVPAKGGGFRGGRDGTWTATKWFVQDEPMEAEVFFNFSLSEKRAEFSEKDPDYREDLIRQFGVALRDGPLPERTPENDPTLTLSGPKVVNWRQIGGSNEVYQFSPDSTALAITASKPGFASKVFVAPTTEPANRKLFGEFEGVASVEQFLSTSEGRSLLVVETYHKNPHVFSSADPQKYWLLDAQGKHAITLPASGTNWFAWKNCISPDANFIALNSWENGPGKQRSRIVHVGNLHSGEWKTAQLPGAVIEVVGWEEGRGIVVTGGEFEKVRMAYSLDPNTGQLSSLNSEFKRAQLSPDGKQSVEIIEKDRLILTDVASREKREFVFQQADKSSAYRDSIHWADDRYLVFNGDRTAFIDSKTLKMSFLTEAKADFNSCEFSPDFKLAIAMKADLHYLGTVKLPE